MRMSEWAEQITREQLADVLPRRWAHVQGVAARARESAHLFSEDGDLLVAAAMLHDIGYAPDLVDTEFHPLDGAAYLESLGADSRVCALVARHSGAIEEAKLRNLESEIQRFPDERTALRDALWWADMTTTPHGQHTTVDERLHEIRQRYGPGHLVSRSIDNSESEIRAAVDRTHKRLTSGRI
ncbi:MULTISPECIES: HD domain-containing protein [unclassified Crossiella]|uniref:HD domain-containing protein n=1 Tax=unclassified Crossiella TaxID=2620835 RepID=UPI001FFF08C6|nr:MULTISPECIES: HD domain-containing protein [unclassified Crossiella]MCK2237830.1 HD domain-containing protein [Crossiella sp. S99.2]MCK2255116.1 HD domain-containing protein [Crossiella sp. S99.1]